MDLDTIGRNITFEAEKQENKKKLNCTKIIIVGTDKLSERVFSMLKNFGIKNIDIVEDIKICLNSIKNYDIIIDCLQDFHYKFELNKLSVENGIPLIFSYITNSSCQTAAFLPDETPCIGCLFEETDIQQYNMENNSELLPIISKLLTYKALNLVLDTEKEEKGNLLTYYSKSEDFQKVRLSKNKNCPVCSKIKTII